MSSRKVVSRTTDSSQKDKLPTSRPLMNSTMVATGSPKIKIPFHANTTINLAGIQAVPKSAATDWTLQCNFAYSEYLRALMTKDIVQLSVKDYEEAADDQLSQQAELLQRAESEKTKLESEIKDTEIQIQIETLTTKFDQIYTVIDEIMQKYNVNGNVIKCSAALENTCNKLYLENIKAFESQVDYDKFSKALQHCTETMKKLKIAIGNTDNMQVLGDHMKTFLALQEEFEKKQKLISDLQMNIGFNLFRNASDKFAALYD